MKSPREIFSIMLYAQYVGAGIRTVATLLLRLVYWQDGENAYFSKTSNAIMSMWDHTSVPLSKHSIFYYRKLTNDSFHLEYMAIFHLLIHYISYLMGGVLVFFSMKKLARHVIILPGACKRAKNDSQVIDEEEVELYTIDSIDEFEKFSKTETSTDAITDSRPEKEDKVQPVYETDISYVTDQDNTQYPRCEKEEINIYSVFTHPIDSIKAALSNFSSGHLPEERKVVPTKKPLNNKTQHESIKRIKEKDSRPLREKTPMKPTTHKSVTQGKALKDRSMNTDIKTYAMKESSESVDDSFTENETDLETEMVMIDLPANYYYQNRLLDKKEPPYLMSLKNNRVKVK